MKKNVLLSAALAGLMTAGIAAAGHAAEGAMETEKCYGIAKAGKNDCANAAGTHSCAGQATADGDKGDFVNVEKGKCAEMGGMMEPGKM